MAKIKNRFSEEIMYQDKNKSLKQLCEKNRADLRGADLRKAYLRGADLRKAYLRGANLCGANLCGAYLRGANLYGADLCGADLCGADLCGADLCGANLCGADLESVKLTEEIKLNKDIKWQQILGLKYLINIFSDNEKTVIKIGCECYLLSEWKKFTDNDIRQMDGNDGLRWWKNNKNMIFYMSKHLKGELNG